VFPRPPKVVGDSQKRTLCECVAASSRE